MIYDECKLYGPYNSGKDGRLRAVLVYPNKRKVTISYPKYIMERHLNRKLENYEDIDHIDGNYLNNDISNLRIVLHGEHQYNDAIRNKYVKVNCTYCGKEFIIAGSKLHQRNRKDRGQSGYFCSRQCSGKYGSAVQRGYITPNKINKVVAKKYTLHKDN